MTTLQYITAFTLLILSMEIASAKGAYFISPSINGSIHLKTWKEMRDDRVVKQDLDFSCGAASAATIMNEFYGLSVTEAELLDAMEKDGTASFQDLADVATTHGIKGVGLALNFDQLRQLQAPAIAYLKYRDNDHFSVVKGIAKDDSVLLADPSWGNRRFTKHQFLRMWETREDENFKGKILLLLPDGIDTTQIDRSFFGAEVISNLSKEFLFFRY